MGSPLEPPEKKSPTPWFYLRETHVILLNYRQLDNKFVFFQAPKLCVNLLQQQWKTNTGNNSIFKNGAGTTGYPYIKI